MTSNIQPAPKTDGAVALSVMIPNFNYARYIGETIESVLAQDGSQFEIVVCDNASTDDSVKVIGSYRDPRIRLAVNPCNVGFSSNLERVAAMARGRRMLLLSSDDRMTPGALAAYERLETALGPRADTAVWGTSTAVIDSNGQRTGVQFDPDPKCWRDCQDEPELSRAVGFPVRSIPAAVLLRRSLELLRSPLPFLTTCYPRALHDAVGSYAGGRLMNPDKWFLWKVLSAADTVYKIDHPLFEYRVHDAGQGPQEQRSGALKHLADEYIATFNLPEEVLRKAGMERARSPPRSSSRTSRCAGCSRCRRAAARWPAGASTSGAPPTPSWCAPTPRCGRCAHCLRSGRSARASRRRCASGWSSAGKRSRASRATPRPEQARASPSKPEQDSDNAGPRTLCMGRIAT